jgi:hypothetical protein
MGHRHDRLPELGHHGRGFLDREVCEISAANGIKGALVSCENDKTN